MTGTAELKLTACHPVEVSLVNVAVARESPGGVERALVGSGVPGPLIEPDAGNEAVLRGREGAKRDRIRIGDKPGSAGSTPEERARAVCVHGELRRSGLDVARVVDRAHLDGAGPVPVSNTGVGVRLVPSAGWHAAPPSTDTSTPATRPPPASAAVPVTVTRAPAP